MRRKQTFCALLAQLLSHRRKSQQKVVFSAALCRAHRLFFLSQFFFVSFFPLPLSPVLLSLYVLRIHAYNCAAFVVERGQQLLAVIKKSTDSQYRTARRAA